VLLRRYIVFTFRNPPIIRDGWLQFPMYAREHNYMIVEKRERKKHCESASRSISRTEKCKTRSARS